MVPISIRNGRAIEKLRDSARYHDRVLSPHRSDVDVPGVTWCYGRGLGYLFGQSTENLEEL